MTRKLEFRVWSKKTNRWIFPEENRADGIFTIGFDGSLREQYYSSHDVCKPEDYIVQESTGLKDKLGNSIFEGDIIQLSFHTSLKHPPYPDEIVEVKWDEGICGFNIAPIPDSEMVIIGNIFTKQ